MARGGRSIVWTEEKITQAVKDWAALYGEPPTLMDWTPTRARARGRLDLVARFEAEGVGRWPYATTCRARFKGSWAAVMEAAGFEARTSGGQRRGRPAASGVSCKACGASLLRATPEKLCGFCLIEMGVETEEAVMAA